MVLKEFIVFRKFAIKSLKSLYFELANYTLIFHSEIWNQNYKFILKSV